MSLRGSSGEARKKRAVLGACGGVVLSLVVARRAPGAGVSLSDTAWVAAVLAGLAAFPRAIVGAAIGLVIALGALGDDGSYAQWHSGTNFVLWGSIIGLIAYGGRWGLDVVAGCLALCSSAVTSLSRRAGDTWRAGATSRKHPFSWLRTNVVRWWRSARQGSMAPSLWKSPPALQLRRSRDTLVVLIAALLYAVARYATDRFYGAFDVSSDEVGVTTASLLLSAAVVTAAALAVVVVGAWAVRVLLRASPTRLGLLGAIGFLVGLQGEGFPDWVDGVIGAAFGAVAWFFIEGSSLGRKPIGWRMFTTLSVAIVFGVVAGALSVSNVGVRQLRDGRPNVPSAGPFIIAPLHAPNVRVWSAGDDDLPSGLDDGACATLFGHAGGVTVLHGAGHVWRVPTERLILIADECRALDG